MKFQFQDKMKSILKGFLIKKNFKKWFLECKSVNIVWHDPFLIHLYSLLYTNQVSISSTFYTCIFCTKVLIAAFLQLRFGFGKSTKALLYEKRTRKMLMKLTTANHFISSLYPWMTFQNVCEWLYRRNRLLPSLSILGIGYNTTWSDSFTLHSLSYFTYLSLSQTHIRAHT